MSDPREGWYPDPLGEADLRRWDGTAWTAETRADPTAATDDRTAASERPEASHARERRTGVPLVLGVVALLAGVAAVLWYLGVFGDDSTVDGSLAGEDAAQEEVGGEGADDVPAAQDPSDAPSELEVPEGAAAWTFEDPAVAFALPETWNDATIRFIDFVDPAAFASEGDAATLVGVYASGADRESPDDTFVIHVDSDASLAEQHATVLSGLGLPADESPTTGTSAAGYATLHTHVEAGVEGFDHTVDVVTLDAGGEYLTFACNAYADGAQCDALPAIVDSALIG